MEYAREGEPTPIADVTRDAHGRRVLSVPGFVSAHSHAFQYGLRGQTQRSPRSTGTFWSWRDAMYTLADSLSPESIYAVSRRAFTRMRRAGVRAVGEFHYVHHQRGGTPYEDRTVLSDAVIRAALDAGLLISLLRVAYARAGAGRGPEGAQRRFCDPDVDLVLRDLDALRTRYANERRVRVGVAPHSVRAVPREWLVAIGAYAKEHQLPLHMHVAEVQGEVDACVEEHGLRPVEFLSELGLLSGRFTAVHATNVSPTEARLLGEAGAHACICPTTERDLGDGLADLATMRMHGVKLCVGVDSHVSSEHLEEVRALELHERLRLRRRVTFEPDARPRTPAEQLLYEGSVHGAWSVGFAPYEVPSTRVLVDDGATDFEEIPDGALADALVFSGSSGIALADAPERGAGDE